MLASGLVLLGMTLIILSFSVVDFEEPESEDGFYSDMESSVPEQSKVLSEEFSGKDFMNNFQVFSFRHRDSVAATGNSLSYTVVLGEQGVDGFNVYVGNFGNQDKTVDVSVDEESESFSVESDRIDSTVFDASNSYSVGVETDGFTESFQVFDNRFILVHYRLEGDGFVRQDTYIG